MTAFPDGATFRERRHPTKGPVMLTLGSAALLLALAAAPDAAPEEPRPATTRFKCETGGDITAQFTARGAQLVAIVDAGDGPHALPYRPWVSGPVKLTWSDGDRTLTWSPGVQIMWMDRGAHRVCGRGEHRHERPVRGDGPARPT